MRTPTGRDIRATTVSQENADCSIILRLVRHFVSLEKRAILFLLCVHTVSPPYTVLRYLVNSQLRCLVITTLNSIYSKKNSQIRYPLVFCLHRTVAPPRRAATTTISLFPRFLLNTSEFLTACFSLNICRINISVVFIIIRKLVASPPRFYFLFSYFGPSGYNATYGRRCNPGSTAGRSPGALSGSRCRRASLMPLQARMESTALFENINAPTLPVIHGLTAPHSHFTPLISCACVCLRPAVL